MVGVSLFSLISSGAVQIPRMRTVVLTVRLAAFLLIRSFAGNKNDNKLKTGPARGGGRGGPGGPRGGHFGCSPEEGRRARQGECRPHLSSLSQLAVFLSTFALCSLARPPTPAPSYRKIALPFFCSTSSSLVSGSGRDRTQEGLGRGQEVAASRRGRRGRSLGAPGRGAQARGGGLLPRPPGDLTLPARPA